ncbi:MAG TPA: Crp/Fnr family transcriptional regulator [Lachnospiraceae bacterium]|jgi:CRP/FNR family transcriptional regulator|nr:Crp/Fnr family transcriptional regulator [Lachnospiraceae bacterium]
MRKGKEEEKSVLYNLKPPFQGCDECEVCDSSCLRNVPFLESLPENEKQNLMMNSEHVRYRKGNYMFREGDSVKSICIILKGKVKLCKFDLDGREQIVGIFSDHETIWEGMLLENSHYPYSAVCLSDVSVCNIKQKDLIKILSDSNVAMKIIELLSKKLHDANERNMLLSTKSPKSRLAAFLIYREKQDHSGTVELKLEDIAASLSLRPETISRKITELESEGLIERSGKSSIKILDYYGLEEV